MTTHYAHVHATHAQQQPIFATRRIVAAILVSVHVYVIITITVAITIAELKPKACEIFVMNLVILKILLNDEYKLECPPNALANKNKLARILTVKLCSRIKQLKYSATTSSCSRNKCRSINKIKNVFNNGFCNTRKYNVN